MRARPNLQTAIAFLTKRVKNPDKDDSGKLKRVLKYLKGTLHMRLVLSVKKNTTVRWWVDTSHGNRSYCKGHAGMMVSLGKGAVMSISRGQKLNTKSSTESELFGIDDALP